jgi:hypothetical protein
MWELKFKKMETKNSIQKNKKKVFEHRTVNWPSRPKYCERDHEQQKIASSFLGCNINIKKHFNSIFQNKVFLNIYPVNPHFWWMERKGDNNRKQLIQHFIRTVSQQQHLPRPSQTPTIKPKVYPPKFHLGSQIFI